MKPDDKLKVIFDKYNDILTKYREDYEELERLLDRKIPNTIINPNNKNIIRWACGCEYEQHYTVKGLCDMHTKKENGKDNSN